MNYRLELAFIIPAEGKKSLTPTVVKATVMKAAEGIDASIVNGMKKTAVHFSSMADLKEYGDALDQFKRDWNKKFDAKMKAAKKAADPAAEIPEGEIVNGTSS